jgi:quinol monooxygenase YgiN
MFYFIEDKNCKNFPTVNPIRIRQEKYGNFIKTSSIEKLVILLTIRVFAKNNVKPNKFQEFIGLCKKLVEETVKEEGCIEYKLYQELNNSGILTMLEEWSDERSLEEHVNSNLLEK